MSIAPLRLSAFLVVLVAACGGPKEFTYTPPASEEGRVCVARCQKTKDACHVEAQRMAAAESERCRATEGRNRQACEDAADDRYQACERDAVAEYTACLKYGKERESCKKASCSRESCEPRSCARSPDYGHCDHEFRGCFQACGGTIGVLE